MTRTGPWKTSAMLRINSFHKMSFCLSLHIVEQVSSSHLTDLSARPERLRLSRRVA